VQAVSDVGVSKRGVKREREQSGDGTQVSGNMHSGGVGAVQGQVANGNGNTTPKPMIVMGAKAGNAGVRPRPLKKRKDIHGQAREMPIQQPTPRA